MKIDGGCLCGDVTYEAEIDPDKVGLCHCTDCQTLSGSAFRIGVSVEEELFEMTSGEPKFFIKTAESGAKRSQAFCPECGTPIYASSVDEGAPRNYGIRVGTIRQRDELVPKVQVWTRSAQHWLGDMDGMKKLEEQPPMPPAAAK